MIRHNTAGGIIFYNDVNSGELFVVLLKNRRDKYLLPKGHIEGSETELETAKREIEEETTIPRAKLFEIAKVSIETHLWTDRDGEHTKDTHFFVFEAREKFHLVPDFQGSVISCDWYSYREALDLVTYSRRTLLRAHELYSEYYN